MEVDDLELLEIVNDYQRRSDEPTFNTLDDIPEALMIEALEEAVKLVKDGDVDCTDMEEFYEDDDYLSPQENGGRATHEIYSAKDDVLLYSNKGECISLMGEMGL